MEELKTLKFIRGGQDKPKILPNGDRYDSRLEIYGPDGKLLHTNPYVNTDHTAGYCGGIVAESNELAGLVGRREKNNARAVFVFQRKYLDKVKRVSNLTKEMVTLESLIANPNHGGALKISCILYHLGGWTWDYSRGCFSSPPPYFDNSMKYLADGERVLIDLVRADGWPAPEFYGGK